MKAAMTEAELAREVVAELQRLGYETYEEVQGSKHGGGRADIVAVRGRIVAVVECKLTLSLQLLDQLTQWKGYAHYIIGAVPPTRGRAAQRFMRSEGFGLWTVGRSYDVEVREVLAPRLHRTALVDGLRSALRPQQRSGQSVGAGTNRGGYFTPFRGTCDALREIVRKQPGIELRSALQETGHHYSSTKSAMSNLPDLIGKGIVAGVRMDRIGRTLKLYPSDDAVARGSEASTV